MDLEAELMQDVPRYLITTAEELTWKYDRPVIFLGEWCRLYSRRHIWSEMDAIVADPYGLGQVQKDNDYIRARSIEERLFLKIYDILNQYHGIKYSKRSWRIIIGHWLSRYTDVMLNRINTLEQCLMRYNVTCMSGYDNHKYLLAAKDSNSAIRAFNDDRWNAELFVILLNKISDCSVECVSGCNLSGFAFEPIISPITKKQSLYKWLLAKLRDMSHVFSGEEDAFIINSYIPILDEIKLQISLYQFPQLWRSPEVEVTEKPNQMLRDALSQEIAIKSDDNIEAIIFEMLFQIMPVCYLEGFIELNRVVDKLNWPQRPRFIFTSNSFDTDEIFKMWVARKIQDGVKYFVGQHGNNYGVIRDEPYSTIEEVTCDKFLTWGWTDKLPQHTPAFILKHNGGRFPKYDLNGGLLLIEMYLGHRITTWDMTYEFEQYFNEQKEFVGKLMPDPKKHLTIRLHSGCRYTRWDEELRWKEYDPSIIIEDGSISINNLIAKSRLVVHSYDSTGILEMLSKNIPMLAFWQNGIDHIRESAKPYYQLLIDAGVVFMSPYNIAKKVNEVWGDISQWWSQSTIQEARKEFCDRYARISYNPCGDLKKIFLSDARV